MTMLGCISRKGPHENCFELGYECCASFTFLQISTQSITIFRHLNHYLRDKKFHYQSSTENAFLEFVDNKDSKLYSQATYNNN